MKILLVKPMYPYPFSKGEATYNRIWPPLCLANCASLLEKEGHVVKILDCHAQRIKPDNITGYIFGYDKIFVTSSALDKWQCPDINLSPFFAVVNKARTVTEEIYVMGYHGTVDPGYILSFTKAKAVMRGEPENIIVDICRGKDLSVIDGVSFISGRDLISNPEHEPLDLKKLPVPSFHLLDFRRYFYEILGRRFAIFEISRGCSFQCSFCTKVMYKEGVRSKSITQVQEEISLAVERHKVRTGYFIDLNFLYNKDIVLQLCDYLVEKKYDFRWSCQARAEFFDLETLRKMKDAGCQIIHIGIESASNELLIDLNKGVDLGKINEKVSLCKKVGIKVMAFFIVGLPKETENDREGSLSLANKLDVDFAVFNEFIPYGNDMIRRGKPVHNTKIASFIRKALIKYYLRPDFILRQDFRLFIYGARLFLARIKSLA